MIKQTLITLGSITALVGYVTAQTAFVITNADGSLGDGNSDLTSIDVGTIALGVGSDPDAAMIFSIGGFDYDGDSVEDVFDVTFNVSVGSGTVPWQSSTDRWNGIANTESLTVAFGGISGTGSNGGSMTLASFQFTESIYTQWQVGGSNDRDRITISQPTIADIVSDSSSANTFTLTSDTSFTTTGNLGGPDGTTGVSLDKFSFNLTLVETGVAVTVPEPGTYALLSGFAALGLVMLRRRQ